MTAALRRPELAGRVFGLELASRYLAEVLPPWVQDLGLLIEKVEALKPAGAPEDWQPGAVLRLPFAGRNCRDGVVVCGPALMALADSAMLFACAAAWNGYRPMTPIDQTTHFLRPVSFDVLADARVVRIGRTTTFARVSLLSATDRRPVGMVSAAYAML
ncbi:MAG: PaaI family thioesterase [Deltaproteobacteria bacterium]|nr:PaaI family thioesterase [Deltaproteobacteria bacterium]